MNTVAEIRTAEDGVIELWTCGAGHLYLSQNKGTIIILTPENLLDLADALRDHLDAQSGKGESAE